MVLDPPTPPDTHRMASCTCWTETSASNPSQRDFRTARTDSTWSSPVRSECTTKCWRVNIPAGFYMTIYCLICLSKFDKFPLFFRLFTDLNSREQETLQPVHVINVDIQDNHEEATLGAFLICELCQCVSVSCQGFEMTTMLVLHNIANMKLIFF